MADLQLFSNNVNYALASDISDVDTTVPLTSGGGAAIGTIAANQFVIGTLTDSDGFYEIVKCTAVSGDNVTVVRAQEGTAGRAFTTAKTAKLGLRLTKGTMERFPQKNADETIAGTWTFSANPTFVGSGAVLGNLDRRASSGTWTKPAGLKFLVVECVGAGGAGGRNLSTSAAATSAGAGGGGGGYVMKKIPAADLGATETVTVGTGGTGSSGGAGGTGGTSSFTITSGTTIQATGGEGANGGSSNSFHHANGVDGGVGTNGDVNIVGQDGSPGFGFGTVSSNAIAVGGAGGSSPLGGGGRGGSAAAGVTTGQPGNYVGGGGGGNAASTSQTATAGPDGADGIVLIWEYF